MHKILDAMIRMPDGTKSPAVSAHSYWLSQQVYWQRASASRS
jgi:hypothetical protein